MVQTTLSCRYAAIHLVYLGFYTREEKMCPEDAVFLQPQTHILRCASFCIFARLQLRHICIYERYIGFAYRINRFGHMLDTVLPR